MIHGNSYASYFLRRDWIEDDGMVSDLGVINEGSFEKCRAASNDQQCGAASNGQKCGTASKKIQENFRI